MENTTGSKLLKLVSFFCFLLLIVSLTAQTSACKVNMRVTQSHNYCGGAEPTPEALAEMTKPHVLPGKKVYIRKGETNDSKSPIVATLVSDSNGAITVSLKPGKYCVVDEKKVNENYINETYKKLKKGNQYQTPVKMDCLKKWLKIPDLVFTAEKGDLKVIPLNYVIPCSWNATPCTDYNGPLPT